MDSRESDGGPRIAIHGGSIRRRPPMAPHAAAAAAASYGTNEDDSLLPSHNEEGYPVLQSYRRRSTGAYYPWYRQPQKLILGAALAWVGSVMYLASLAHSILRTQKKAFHNNIMGSSMVDSNADFKQWLESEEKLGVVHKTNEADMDGNINNILIDHWKYGASDQTNEDFQRWLQTQSKYGASSSIVNEGKANVNVRFGSTVDSQAQKNEQIKYGAGSDQTNEDFQKWLQSQNKYGASDSVSDSDFQKWLESQNKYGLKSSDLGDAYQVGWPKPTDLAPARLVRTRTFRNGWSLIISMGSKVVTSETRIKIGWLRQNHTVPLKSMTTIRMLTITASEIAMAGLRNGRNTRS